MAVKMSDDEKVDEEIEIVERRPSRPPTPPPRTHPARPSEDLPPAGRGKSSVSALPAFNRDRARKKTVTRVCFLSVIF